MTVALAAAPGAQMLSVIPARAGCRVWSHRSGGRGVVTRLSTDASRVLVASERPLACDLVVLIIVTGILRRRFATASNPWLWRALHGTAYLCWPLAVLHGLLAGRLAKPYVDWSYGACLAAAELALTMRFVATVRSRDTAAQPVPEQPASALYAAPAVLDRLTGWPAPPGSTAGPAVGRAAAAGLARPAPAAARRGAAARAGRPPGDGPGNGRPGRSPRSGRRRRSGTPGRSRSRSGPPGPRQRERALGRHEAVGLAGRRRPYWSARNPQWPGPGEPAGGAWR